MAGLDSLVYEDAGVWIIEAREGSADGKSRWFELPDEDVALDCVRDLSHGEGAVGPRATQRAPSRCQTLRSRSPAASSLVPSSERTTARPVFRTWV